MPIKKSFLIFCALFTVYSLLFFIPSVAHATDTCAPPTISGPDAVSSSSAQYTVNNSQGGTKWCVTGSGESIDANGLVTLTSNSCGSLTVTATTGCGTASKDVRITTSGVWILQSQNCSAPCSLGFVATLNGYKWDAYCGISTAYCEVINGANKTVYSVRVEFESNISPMSSCPAAPCNTSPALGINNYAYSASYKWQCPSGSSAPTTQCAGSQQPTCPDCGKQCGPDMGSSASIVSGNLYHDQTLFQIPNTKPAIDFTISYNSLDTYTGPLGKGWTHSFNINITKNSSQSLTLMKSDGKRISFSSSSSANTYIPDVQTGEHAVIIQNSDSSYTLTYKDGTSYAFDSKGRLAKIQDLNQNTITLSYTGDNLASISDSFGRIIQLLYDVNHHITQISKGIPPYIPEVITLPSPTQETPCHP